MPEPPKNKEFVDEVFHIASVREAEEIEEVGVHLHVLDVIETLAEEEHVELLMVTPHCKELLERLPLCSTLEIHDVYVVDDHVTLRLDVCVLDGLRHHSVVLGVLRIISVLISRRVRNHVKPVRADINKQLFEEGTLYHAALAEKQNIISPF